MDEWQPPDRYLKVFGSTGIDDIVRVEIDDEPRVDSLVSQWIDSGKTKDAVVHLTLVTGGSYHTLASQITGWLPVDFSDLKREIRWNRYCDEREKQIKQELGIWDE